MPLNKPALKNSIVSLLKDMQTRDTDSVEEFAERLSGAIETFVKSGTVSVQPGIPVSTTGSAVAQTGATTANGTGTIN